MSTPTDKERSLVLVGRVLTFNGDPSGFSDEKSFNYWEKGFVVIKNGLISDVGELTKIPDEATVVDYGEHLICAGFIDAHVHYPQINVIASYGTQLLEWLDKYTFPEEARFSNKEVADKAAAFFLDELLKNGFTTAAVYCTSHPVSVDAFFEESSRRNLRVVAGKVLMDRNAPISVRDTAKTGYDQSKALIDKWHGRGRNLYAVTPRFAPTSSPEQLELAGALYKSADGVFVQSHVSENLDEVSWVNELFPDADSYLDVYSHFGLLGPRALYGHGIHFSDSEIALAAETGAAIVHCPTSNLFMGSGLFQFERLKNSEVSLAFGTDIAGGTSLSPFATMKSAYEISQLQGYSISPEEAFYTATLGGAKAMHLDDRIGRIAIGYEADLVVIDLKSTPMIENRTNRADNLGDLLFAQIVLADDRAIRATYAAGNLVYDRKVLLDNPIKG